MVSRLAGKKLMKLRKKTSWKPHFDVSPEAALINQEWMAGALNRLGQLPDYCYGVRANGAPSLRRSHCQYRAMATRRLYEKDTCALMRQVADDSVSVMVNIIVPGRLRKRPFKQSEMGSFRQYICERLKRSDAIVDFVGVFEADYLSGEGRSGWVLTLHGAATVRASSFRSASRFLHKLVDLRRDPLAYRPVMVRQIDDLPGAVRYIFKSFNAPSIVERASWSGETEAGKIRKFSRKVRLKKPQLAQLSESLIGASLHERVIWISQSAR